MTARLLPRLDRPFVSPSARESASPAEFAAAMSRLAAGVVIVTCRVDGRPWGMTVTAFTSVSAAPPTVLVSLGSTTTAARTISRTRRFGVSLLAEEHLTVARVGSTPGAGKFLEPFVEASSARTSPLVTGALAHLDCVVDDVVHVADHSVLFGRVLAARSAGAGEPLVYQHRTYRALGDSLPGAPRPRGA
jgi:3-hydroxy-9,10-secoandrosta-1,3,5(10)-triene-9,17-dione monooxygenase reductase component